MTANTPEGRGNLMIKEEGVRTSKLENIILIWSIKLREPGYSLFMRRRRKKRERETDFVFCNPVLFY